MSDDRVDAEARGRAGTPRLQSFGPTLDKSLMRALLDREFAALFKLREAGVRERCYDDVSGSDQEPERLKQRIRRLLS